MPSEHYMVEAKLILSHAPEDVPRSEEIRTAIKDIWDIRAAKLRTSMDDFIRGEGTYAKLDYLTGMEIHSVRPLLPHSLDMIARLERDSAAFATTGSVTATTGGGSMSLSTTLNGASHAPSSSSYSTNTQN